MAACDPWTEAELAAVHDSRALAGRHGPRNRALLLFSCTTGARVSEALRMRWRDLYDGQDRIRARVTFTRTKNKHSRTVPLSNALLAPALDSYRATLGDPDPDARPWPFTRWTWLGLIKAASLEAGLRGNFGTHSCRKTWARATYQYYHGRAMAGQLVDPLVKLQEAGGWRTIDAARRYISFMLGDTTEAMAELYPGLREGQNTPTKLTNGEISLPNA